VYQQPAINKKDLKFGSMKVEISDNGIDYTSLGTGNKVKFSEKLTVQDIKSDNGGVIDTIVQDQTCETSISTLEFEQKILQQARGGIDDYSELAGNPVNGYSQLAQIGEWKFNKFIKFAQQSANNAAINPTSVTAATDGLLVSGTDYYVGQNAAGEYGIFIVDSAKVTTENQAITIVFNYTPVAAKVFKSGGKTSIKSQYVRLTNKRASDGKRFIIDIYKARISDGISIDFPGDDEGKAWENDVKFSGSKNPDREPGDQLFKITNEQL
jgi:hypothetical protein